MKYHLIYLKISITCKCIVNLHFLFPGPLVDYSVRVSHMERNDIMMGLGLADEGQGTEKLRKSLAKKYKDNHHIHKKLETFTNAELNEICANLSLPIPKHRDRKMKKISDHFFGQYPDAPLTNLERMTIPDKLHQLIDLGHLG